MVVVLAPIPNISKKSILPNRELDGVSVAVGIPNMLRKEGRVVGAAVVGRKVSELPCILCQRAKYQ